MRLIPNFLFQKQTSLFIILDSSYIQYKQKVDFLYIWARLFLFFIPGHILDNSTKDHKFVFRNLVPFTTYNVYVGAETSAGVGPKTSLTVFTPADGKFE